MKQSDNGSKSKTERDWTTTTTTTKTGKLQNMTRTAPRAISLENHKKEFQYEGRTRQVMEPENALEKCARSEANAARNAFLPLIKIQKHNRHFQMIKCLLYARSVRLDRQQNIFPSGST